MKLSIKHKEQKMQYLNKFNHNFIEYQNNILSNNDRETTKLPTAINFIIRRLPIIVQGKPELCVTNIYTNIEIFKVKIRSRTIYRDADYTRIYFLKR